MKKSKLIKELFFSIGKMDADKFATFLADNAKFKFGNAPAVNGKNAIKKTVEDFFASIKGLSHNILDTWVHPGAIICQGKAVYTRRS